MADDANNAITAAGAAFNAMPIEYMVSSPILAAVKAQIMSSRAYIDFIREVGFDSKTGKLAMVEFEVDEQQIGANGQVTGSRSKKIRVPLLAVVTHPSVNVETVTVDFEMTVESSMEDRSSTESEGGFDATIGWAFIKVKVHGKVSHKSEQTRKTDTRAKYSFHIEAKRSGPSEGMSRVLDYLVDEATRPAITQAAAPTT